MKFKKFIAIAALAPLALLASGCGGAIPLSFTPNWYSDTTTSSITGTYEQLEYDVTFETYDGDITLSYDNGPRAYVTTLTDENYTDANGETTLAYHLHSELHLTGRYTLAGVQDADFEDSMVSDVWFRRAADGLTPLESRKSVHSTLPASTPVSGAVTTTYEYEFNVLYSADLLTAECTLKNTLPEVSEKKERVELDEDGTFLDNEQIAFALRGLGASAANFTSLDPQTRRPVTVGVGAATAISERYTFMLNGEQVDEDISALHVPVSYQMSEPGPQRDFYYAAVTNAKSNRFRSVLLRFQSPVVRGLGKMTYTLSNATFNLK